jgi:hypothetical protein
MERPRHRHITDQIDAISRELSKLAIACDIKIFEPGSAERILRNDDSICGIKNARAFEQIRHHLMALFPLEERAIERLGPQETQKILDYVRASIIELRQAGSSGSNTYLRDEDR